MIWNNQRLLHLEVLVGSFWLDKNNLTFPFASALSVPSRDEQTLNRALFDHR
jgi:hypothetical protein